MKKQTILFILAIALCLAAATSMASAMPKPKKAEIASTSIQSQTRQSLRLAAVRPAKSTDKATIILTAVDYWEDGSGYQLLFDKDHTAVDEITADVDAFEERLNNMADEPIDYTQWFEYMLPETSTGVIQEETTNRLVEGTLTMQLEPGIYDVLVLLLDTEKGYTVWGANGSEWEDEDFMLDDYEFKAGEEYVFYINDEIDFHITPHDDIAITASNIPVSSARFGTAEPLSVTITNNGKEALEGPFYMIYTVNGDEPVKQQVTLEPALEPGGSTQFTFTQSADLSEKGTYELMFLAVLEDDANQENDTLRATVYSVETRSLPFFYPWTVESELEDWIVINTNGSRYSWQWFYYPQGEGQPEEITAVGIYPWDVTEDMPEYLLTKAPLALPRGQYKLSFKARTSSIDEDGEHLGIVYGTEAICDEMEELADFPAIKTLSEWEPYSTEFEINKKGDYFFAFKAYKGDWLLYLDSMELVCLQEYEPEDPSANTPVLTTDLCVKVTPNPAQNLINFSTPQSNIEQICIYAVTGKEIYRNEKVNAGVFRYNVSALQSGLYFARIRTDKGLTTVKFMVK